MAWVNPETFEVLGFLARVRVTSRGDWDTMIAWCNANRGAQGVDWQYSNEPMQYPQGWWFRVQAGSVHFQMVWG